MSSLSRRGFLGGAAALLAAARLRAVDLPSASAAPLAADPFTLGVASGDPLPTSVVLWTRLAIDPLNGGGMPPEDRLVTWQVATDVAFVDIVASGTEPAVAALAHSVHVDVNGLEPDRWYHYRFVVDGYTSAMGRTRTTPAADDRTPLRIGAASCQNWRAGYYTAHAHLAEEGCDVVLFLGDYIYENGGSGPVRAHLGGVADTLEEYRNRYGLYKGDSDLQAAHAACPWVVIWDDHEVANNYAGAIAADGSSEAVFLARRAAAYQAWFEHQPVRLDPPTGPDLAIHRRVEWGGLARIHLPDTRQHRDDQPCGDGNKLPCPGLDDPARSMLGADQEAWLEAGLTSSTAVWDVFAQQVVFAPMPIGETYNMDQWDGYPAARDRAWAALRQRPNPLVLSGDVHFGGVVRLHETLTDEATPRVGTELVVGSISSQFTAAPPAIIEVALDNVAWWEHCNAADRGYTIIDLTEDGLHAELRVVSTALQPSATISTNHTVDLVAVPVARPVQPTTTTTAPENTTTTTDPAGDPGGDPSPEALADPDLVGGVAPALAVRAQPRLTG